MEYKNPDLPEGINTSKEHPLKEFTLLITGIALLCAIIIAILVFTAHLLAPRIPFSTEQEIAAHFMPATETQQSELTRYLQGLANQLAAKGQLPEGMTITVHYINEPTVNAFATLGGHVFMFRGLLEKMPHENALAMVMAHEIAHIKHRHPIKQIGRAAIIGTALTVVSSTIGNSIVDSALGQAGLLTTLNFSREHEIESDESALVMLNEHYGHVGGANALFDAFKLAEKQTAQIPEFFNTHPNTDGRTDNINANAAQHHWQTHGSPIPLPESFQQWLTPAES